MPSCYMPLCTLFWWAHWYIGGVIGTLVGSLVHWWGHWYIGGVVGTLVGSLVHCVYIVDPLVHFIYVGGPCYNGGYRGLMLSS